jgi:hypothetical protein
MREMLLERHSEVYTLFVVTLLMFGGWFGVVTSTLPSSTWPPASIVFSGLSALSFVLLIWCMFVIANCRRLIDGFNIYNTKEVYSCGLVHGSFEIFFACHCLTTFVWARHLFLAGTISLLLTVALGSFCRWYFSFGQSVAAVM